MIVTLFATHHAAIAAGSPSRSPCTACPAAPRGATGAGAPSGAAHAARPGSATGACAPSGAAHAARPGSATAPCRSSEAAGIACIDNATRTAAARSRSASRSSCRGGVARPPASPGVSDLPSVTPPRGPATGIGSAGGRVVDGRSRGTGAE